VLLLEQPENHNRRIARTMNGNGTQTSKKRLPGAERRSQILSTAASLFSRQGLSGVTIKEIADACGINQAMLYRHYPSKERLYVAVVEDKIRRLDIGSFLATIPIDQPIKEVLKTLALHILSIGSKDPEINRLLLFGTLCGTKESHALFQAWRQPFVDFLQKELVKRMKSGELRRVDPHITARSFIGMVMDCSTSCLLWPEFGYEEFNPDKAVGNNVEIFLRGMRKAQTPEVAS
jgi:AcrR family transcriptional regulator